MAGGIYGADVHELRDTAGELARGASALDGARTALTTRLSQSRWTGPDGDRFRAQWNGELTALLRSAQRGLDDAATALRRNADEQEKASAADGSGYTGGPAFPSDGGHHIPLNVADGGAGGPVSGPPAGAEADDVRSWWDSLSAAEQKRLMEEDPGLLGRLDGVPAAVRDEANRAFLESELARLTAEEPQRWLGRGMNPAWNEWREQMDSLENVDAALREDSSLSLLLLDTREGRVEVALARGDVDTADHVGIYTQGLFSNTAKDGGISGPMTQLKDLDRTARSLLLEDGRAGETTAMIMWMGYDSPQSLDVLGDGDANRGAPLLASFADGVRANNTDGHLTALGHSYGSLVTGIAARQTDAFDSIAIFGSPGINGDLSEVNVDKDQFYVLKTPLDPVAKSGAFGDRPHTLDGAQELATGPRGDLTGPKGSDFLDWRALISPGGSLVAEGFAQHSDYLVDKSTSQQNLAAVVVGADDRMIR